MRVIQTRIATIVIFLMQTGLMGLHPPDASQWQELQENGKLGIRQASARQYGNEITGIPLVNRALELRQDALVASKGIHNPAGFVQELSYFPDTWGGLPSVGEIKMPVFLMDFAGQRASVNFPGLTPSRVHANIFVGGTNEAHDYLPFESLRNFYLRASNELFSIRGNTFGWYHFPYSQEYYKPIEASDDLEMIWYFARTILEAYDFTIDYSDYDNDNDGYVDALNFIWCGEIGEWSSFWWAYQWSFSNESAKDYMLDGVRFRDFSWQWVEVRPNEQNDFDPTVLIHELAHLLGLPDLYDYEPEVGPEGGIGGAGLMASGASGNINAYFRWLLGWIEPEVHVVGEEVTVNLTPSSLVDSSNPAMVVYFENPSADIPEYRPFSEMLVVENRQALENDGGIANLPVGGLFFWHVNGEFNDSGNGFKYNNSRTQYKLMRLIQCDGLEEIEQYCSRVDSADLFRPGDTLSPWSVPASKTSAYAPSRLVLNEISESPQGGFSIRLSSYTGPLVRVSPSQLHLRTAPGLRHPPVKFSFSSESFEGSVSLGTSQLLSPESEMQTWDVAAEGQGSDYLFWETATRELHMTREHLVFTPSLPSAPAVSIPVQMQVRIPLEDALSFWKGFWNTGNPRPWYGQEEVTHSDPFAAASGKISDYQQTSLSGWIWGPGTVSFYIKTSTEANRDKVSFQLGGSTRLTLSGERDWQRFAYYTYEQGVVPFRWVYRKDGSGSAGADQVWVDDFQFTPSYLTWFEAVANDFGYSANHTNKPFADDRTLFEHFAFADDPFDLTQMEADVEWPRYEVIPGEAFATVRMHYPSPHYGAVYTPQASPDGYRWFTLVDGEEGVQFNNVDWNTSTTGSVDIPAYSYRFFRLNLMDNL